jgi:zinc protease
MRASILRLCLCLCLCVATVLVFVGTRSMRFPAAARAASSPSLSPPASSPPPVARAPSASRRPGPAGSLILVDSQPAFPLVRVVVAVRAGSAWDPRRKDGLANLLGEMARRHAAGRARADIDARLDALGASLEVRTDPDSLRFEGHVLTRHLDAFLAILAEVVLRPDFEPAELARTREEILATIDESRNDDQALCARYFIRDLYAEHPYAHAPDGDRASLLRITAGDLAAFHRRHFVGGNVIFAAHGDVTPQDLDAAVVRHFGALAPGKGPGPNPLAIRDPVAPQGWRINIVDKPEREQVQIMFGHIAVAATNADFVPFMIATSAFGGHGMTSTMMSEVRTKRGLAYGAYMQLSQRLGRGASVGSVFSARDKAIITLKLVLRLYVALMEKGLSDEQLNHARTFLAGSYASEMDDPERRLDARVTAEVTGLPPGFVDQLPQQIASTSNAQIRAAMKRHVHARDLAITVVATAADFRSRLLDSRVAPSAVDVVPYEKY